MKLIHPFLEDILGTAFLLFLFFRIAIKDFEHGDRFAYSSHLYLVDKPVVVSAWDIQPKNDTAAGNNVDLVCFCELLKSRRKVDVAGDHCSLHKTLVPNGA